MEDKNLTSKNNEDTPKDKTDNLDSIQAQSSIGNQTDLLNNENNENDDVALPSDGNEDSEPAFITPIKTCFKRYFGSIGPGSLRGGIFAMASITFGSGCLSFPNAVKSSGPVLSIFIFCIVLAVSYWTLTLLIKAGRKLQLNDYNDLIVATIGNKFRVFSDINNILLCLGTIMSYQYTISGFSTDLAKDFFDYVPESDTSMFKFIQMFSCMILFQIPLGLLKNISKLQYASIIGVFTLLYVIIVVTIEMPFYLTNFLNGDNTIIWFPTLNFGVLDTFAIFTFGFSSHNGIFPIYQELKHPTKRRAFKVLNRAVTLEVILYLLIAYAGFFSTFYNSPDVFIRRPDLPGFNDYFIKIGKILLIICLHCIMAVNYNIMRQSFKFMFFNNETIPFYTDVIITISTYIISNLLTFFIMNITTIFNFIGGICTIVITTFNPIMINIFSSELPLTHYTNVLKFILCFIWSALGIATTAKSIVDFI